MKRLVPTCVHMLALTSALTLIAHPTPAHALPHPLPTPPVYPHQPTPALTPGLAMTTLQPRHPGLDSVHHTPLPMPTDSR